MCEYWNLELMRSHLSCCDCFLSLFRCSSYFLCTSVLYTVECMFVSCQVGMHINCLFKCLSGLWMKSEQVCFSSKYIFFVVCAELILFLCSSNWVRIVEILILSGILLYILWRWFQDFHSWRLFGNINLYFGIFIFQLILLRIRVIRAKIS